MTQYNCNTCNYFTSKKSQYNRHLHTEKNKNYKNTNCIYNSKSLKLRLMPFKKTPLFR